MKMKIGSKTLDISNPDKMIYPKDEITKSSVVKYYEKISEIILPHIKERPITMQRFPNGIHKEGFFQQNISNYFPKWIPRITVQKDKGKTTHVLCNSKRDLIFLANQDCITPHIWLSRKGSLNKPDKLIFDLDPPGDDFEVVSRGAKKIKNLLEGLELKPFVMTTGSSGLHVVSPLENSTEFDEVRDFAKDVAEVLVKNNKGDFTIKHRIKKRGGKLFIDYLRNSFGQSSVSPYALRVYEGAPVATPIDWDELNKKNMNSRYYNIKNIAKRMKQKSDPWKKFFNFAKSLNEPRKILNDGYR